MMAIHTRYLGPTNTKGARIRATCVRADCTWTVTIALRHDRANATRHADAVQAMFSKYAPELQEESIWCCGNTLDNRGYVFAVYPQTLESLWFHDKYSLGETK